MEDWCERPVTIDLVFNQKAVQVDKRNSQLLSHQPEGLNNSVLSSKRKLK